MSEIAPKAAESTHWEPGPLASLARMESYPWLVVGTVCIGAFMGQLDASIAQLVLPTLQTTFRSSLADVSWVSLAYLLVLASTLPIFGRLADIYGRKLLYTGGFLVFILGSGLCGFAHSLGILIAARVLQAIGAGLLQANSVAIITAAAGPQRRGRAIGIQGAAQAIGLSLGPALGGLLIQAIGWRWVFWINVPAGILGTILGWFILPRTEGMHLHDRGFDWLGAWLLTPALALVLIALSEAPSWGLGSPLFIGCALAGTALIVVFVLHQRRAKPPLIDLTLFKSHAFSAGNLAGLISYGLLFGVFLLVPFALEGGYHDAPFAAGLRLATIPIALGIIAPFAGALSDKLGPRWLTAIGMAVAALSLVGLAFALDGAPGSLVAVTALLAIFGLGQGLFTSPNNSAIMGAAPLHRLGAAGGVLNVTRTLGTSLGVAVASSLLSWAIASYGHFRDTLDAPRAVLLAGIHDVLFVFAALALIAAGISMLRGREEALDEAHREEIALIERSGGV